MPARCRKLCGQQIRCNSQGFYTTHYLVAGQTTRYTVILALIQGVGVIKDFGIFWRGPLFAEKCDPKDP